MIRKGVEGEIPVPVPVTVIRFNLAAIGAEGSAQKGKSIYLGGAQVSAGDAWYDEGIGKVLRCIGFKHIL